MGREGTDLCKSRNTCTKPNKVRSTNGAVAVCVCCGYCISDRENQYLGFYSLNDRTEPLIGGKPGYLGVNERVQ